MLQWVQLERERSRASPSFSRVGGMVDILKVSSPCRKQRPAPLASPRLTAIQPSGPRKPEPLRTRNNTPREPPKEVKFSKYSPLPSIKGKIRPKLLRERTYDVIEPIFVKVSSWIEYCRFICLLLKAIYIKRTIACLL